MLTDVSQEMLVVSPWLSAALSQMVSEVMLQVVSLYVICKTIRYGSSHGFYHYRSDINLGTVEMYVGAPFYLACVCLLLIPYVALSWVFTLPKLKSADVSLKNSGFYGWRFINLFTKIATVLYCFWLFGIFIASWMFWGGFVRLAGEL